MDLPKNITQIGETDKYCKIFVEDYAISYMKQLNVIAADKDIGVALYGVYKEEEGISYLFLYGACRLNFLQKETRHLSQAQMQEIERNRRKFFKEYSFLGYRILNGEAFGGLYVCLQGICRYVGGYARFYEQNDVMLAYMLESREETQADPGEREIYREVRMRQDARRTEHQRRKGRVPEPRTAPDRAGKWKGAAAVLAMMGVVGLAAADRAGQLDDLHELVRTVWEDVMVRRLPDTVPASTEGVDSIVAEEQLTDAILAEQPVHEEEEPLVWPEEPAALEEETVSRAEDPAPISYSICPGDTLTAICRRTYGDDSRLEEVCTLNGISDPDDIKVGEKILLP